MNYSDKLRLLKDTMKCSWDTIAKHIGVSRNTLYAYLSNNVDPKAINADKINELLQQYGLQTHNKNYDEIMQSAAWGKLDNNAKLLCLYCYLQYDITSKSLNDPIGSKIRSEHIRYFKMTYEIAAKYFTITNSDYKQSLFDLMRYGFIQLVSDPDIDDLFKLTDEWKNK